MIINSINIVKRDTDFPVNLHDIIKWLDIYPHGARKTLIKSYKEGVDYIKRKVYNPTNGQPMYLIYLSIDCFTKLCLKTKSIYGDIIRNYFVVVEKMYREYMITGIMDRQRSDDIDYEDKNYGKPNFPVGKCVYIIRIVHDLTVRYKIGMTSNLNRRILEHRRQIPGEIRIVLYEMYDHHKFLESCIHRFLEKYERPMCSLQENKLTEIFETDIDKIQKLIIKCQEFSQSVDMLSIADADTSIL